MLDVSPGSTGSELDRLRASRRRRPDVGTRNSLWLSGQSRAMTHALNAGPGPRSEEEQGGYTLQLAEFDRVMQRAKFDHVSEGTERHRLPGSGRRRTQLAKFDHVMQLAKFDQVMSYPCKRHALHVTLSLIHI